MIASVSAISGGDRVRIFNTPCIGTVKVQVNATEQIDEGEYLLTPCTMDSPENWSCECSEVWLETQVNTVNEYGFIMEYQYQEQSSGGGRRSTRRYYVVDNETIIDEEISDEVLPIPKPEENIPGEVVPPTFNETEDVVPGPEPTPEPLPTPTETDIEKEWPWYYYVVPVIIIIFILLLVKGRKGKGDGALPVAVLPPNELPTTPPASAVSGVSDIPLPPKEFPKIKKLRKKRITIDDNANIRIIEEYDVKESK